MATSLWEHSQGRQCDHRRDGPSKGHRPEGAGQRWSARNGVTFGNAAENLSRVRYLVLTLLKQETTAKVGIKAKRLMAGWDENDLLEVLRI